MNRTRSIALPVAGVLILGMALIMVISTVVTLIVFLLTDNDSRQRIAVDIVGRFLIEETKDTRSGSPNSAYVPAKTIELACPSSNDLRLFGLWKNGVSGSVCGLI